MKMLGLFLVLFPHLALSSQCGANFDGIQESFEQFLHAARTPAQIAEFKKRNSNERDLDDFMETGREPREVVEFFLTKMREGYVLKRTMYHKENLGRWESLPPPSTYELVGRDPKDRLDISLAFVRANGSDSSSGFVNGWIDTWVITSRTKEIYQGVEEITTTFVIKPSGTDIH